MPDSILRKFAGVKSHTLITGYAALASVVEPQEIAPTILDDPDDAAVQACAMAASAQAIVSGDSHLLDLGHFSNIPILSAAELLQQLNN